MTPEIYNNLSSQQRRDKREAYSDHQGGLCWHCKTPLFLEPPESITEKEINWRLFPPHFLAHPVHLQHDHKTGLTEGAVHAYCNAVLWQYHGK